jgi:integrase
MAYAEKRDGKVTGWIGEVDLRHKTGTRFRRRFDTKKQAEGYEVFVKMMGEEPPMMGGPQSGRTFAEVAQLCKDAGGAKGAWKRGRDHSALQRLDHCVAVLGAYDIAAVDTTALDKLVSDLRKRPARHGQPMTNSTINRYLDAASSVLTFALERRMITHKPKVPKQKEVSKKRALLHEELEAEVLWYLEDAGQHMSALAVRVLLETGMREGELLGSRSDKPLRVDQIRVDESGNGWIMLDEDQTKNSESRLVYIRQELAQQLIAAIRQNALPNGWLLLNHFKTAVKAAGGPENCLIHSLRHTRNTRLMNEGVDIKLRMQMLGQKDAATNLRYSHVSTADQLAAAKKLEKPAGETHQTAQIVPFPAVKSA